MLIKKIQAANMTEAFKLLKAEFGDEAVILNKTRTAQGVELLISTHAQPKSVSNSSADSAKQRDTVGEQERELLADLHKSLARNSAYVEPRSADDSPPVRDNLQAEMLREILVMRQQLEKSLAAQSAPSSDLAQQEIKTSVANRLLDQGFSTPMIHTLLGRLPLKHDTDAAWAWVQGVLMRNLKAKPLENMTLERGGVVALVGNTGSGKTTTIAKLAAQWVVKHGVDSVGLITIDHFRVAAREQLQVYGGIMDIPVYSAGDATQLKNLINTLQRKRLILIDTTGVPVNAAKTAEQTDLLHSVGAECVLVANAAHQSEVLDQLVSVYKSAGVKDCILSKVDECIRLGGALDVMIRHKMELNYITTGQAVPEDLRLANVSELIQMAFSVEPSKVFTNRFSIELT